jgi:cytochrome c556
MRRIFLRAPLAFGLALGLTFGVACAQQTEPDLRTPTVRTPAQKAFVLEQMRLFVASIQQISEGLAADDKAKVAAAARPRGLIAIRALPNKPPGLSEAETPEWKSFGMATRNGFDAVADAAEKSASTAEILALLATTTKNCVACHQTFRLVEGDPTER